MGVCLRCGRGHLDTGWAGPGLVWTLFSVSFISPSHLSDLSAETEEPETQVGLLLFPSGGKTSPGLSGNQLTCAGLCQ